MREDERIVRMRPGLAAHVLAVSVVTVAELKRGALLRRWSERRVNEMEDFLRRYVVIAIDSDVAEEWARTRVRCDQLGRRKADNDLWIAATAKRYEMALATLDRDQQDIPGLRVIGEDGIELAVPE